MSDKSPKKDSAKKEGKSCEKCNPRKKDETKKEDVKKDETKKEMKKLFLVVIAALVLCSCGAQAPTCLSYGFTKKITRQGTKSQSRYAKGKGHI